MYNMSTRPVAPDRVFGIYAAVTGHVESAVEVKISVTTSHTGDSSKATGK